MTHMIPILLYHDIESEKFPCEKKSAATRDTVVAFADFKAQMEYLFLQGYQTLTLTQYYELLLKKGSVPKKSVIITFDDGHYSNYELALPVLMKYDFKAVFFIIAGRIDEKYHLTRSQIREMSGYSMEIGSHGLSHTYLPLLDRGQVQDELRRSKQILEQVIKKKVLYFCFPGGHYNQGIIEILKSTGYKGACSCHIGLNTAKTDAFLLKRIEIRNRCTLEYFAKSFHPSYLFRDRAVEVLKGGLKKMIGLDNYVSIRSKFYRFYIFKR